jgi:hypothetical protein
VQLATVSLLVAAACWRAWSGQPRWVLWSAMVLGVCAGVRPEIGIVLFPLWAACALHAPVSWRQRAWALGGMAAAVLLWLVPTMIASGGPLSYIRACVGYISDQASETSGLFGAAGDKWHTTFWRLIAWTCCGLLAWTLPGVLAWRWKEGWNLQRDKLAFLSLWVAPPFVFAILVHLQDPGQSLAMAPPIALFGGYLFNRALENLDARVSRWHTVTLVFACLAVAWVMEFRDRASVVIWLPPIALAAGLLLKIDQVKNPGYLPRAVALAFLLAPVVIVNSALFYFEGWYYKGPGTIGIAGAWEQALSDLTSGLALTSLAHINHTLDVDDHSLRQTIRLAAERPGQTIVVWEHGLVAWRKAAYYLPGVPIVVLEHELIRSGSPPVIAIWKGPVLSSRIQGPAPLSTTLPEGGRVVWLLNPRTEFYSMVSRSFPMTPAGPAYYTDLPAEKGARQLGEYQLAW